MSADVIERYYQLRQKLSAIEEEIEELKPRVIERLRGLEGEVQLDGHVLSLGTYVAWDYSQRIVSMQEQLLQAKRQERLEGRAKERERRQILVLRSSGGQDELRERPPEGEWETEDR